ncbi:MAG TPA: hypothetical protein QF784_00540, partial [Prochlorococcaceae cyanobacterium Fu_MAG_134]|nr:hypothetical protein [Prochlorococcaceae cyanobacterium Fu_MAG_134]
AMTRPFFNSFALAVGWNQTTAARLGCQKVDDLWVADSAPQSTWRHRHLLILLLSARAHSHL